MAYDGRAIANCFLEIAASEGELLTHLKLQKLLYYAHGWRLALSGKPLVAEGFEAWPLGPVTVEVFNHFRIFKGTPITFYAMRPVPTEGGFSDWEPYQTPRQKDVLALVKQVYSAYKRYSANQLSQFTHAKGTPWASVTDNGKNRNLKRPISNDLIRDYFAARMLNASAKA